MAIMLALVGCTEEREPSSLVVITVDTTRADRLGAYGYEGAQTPVIDGLAAEGTLFENAYAPVPETLPSHSSIFTGHYPPSHAVRLNLNFHLPDKAQTLAEVLRDEGYHTVAVTSATVLDREYGLDQGFLVYDDVSRDRVVERRAGRVTELALSALEQLDDRPYFLWVHYYDAHSPFDPPQPFRGNDEVPPEDPILYDREIAYMDHAIGDLLAGLEESGRLDSTYVALVGDHGESLGEHGESYHTLFLYDSTIHVPMILKGPGVAAGKRVLGTVSNIDLFATLLQLLGITPPESSSRALPGTPVATDADSEGRVAYGESMAPPFRFGWQALEAIRNEEWLYVRAPEEELYRLDGSDPGQRVNLAFDNRDELAQMRSLLDSTLGAMPKVAEDTDAGYAPTDEALGALEALGYLGAGQSREGMPAGADPKDMVEVAEAYQLARLASRLGELAKAEELLEWAVTIDPKNLGCRRLLGRVQFSLQRYEQSAVHLAAAVDVGGSSWDLLVDLAAAQERTSAGPLEGQIDRALAAAPDPIEVWRRLGRHRAEAGAHDEASEAFRELLALAPEDARARVALDQLSRLAESR